MRYLFGFTRVLAVGFMSIVGCSETNGGDSVACEGHVCPCSEAGIRAAIAEGGGPFTFDCGGPTMVVTAAEIVIGNDVILDGEGNLTVDGNDDHTIFSITSEDITAELWGFTVTKGAERFGGGINSSGTLTLTDSTVSGNTASVDGGGIYSSGTLTLTDSTVSGNRAERFGGGIYPTRGGTLTLTESTVSGNRANSDGGGISNNGRLTLTESTVTKNTAVYGGGINNDGVMTMINSKVSGNAADFAGGGISNNGRLTLTESTVSGNRANSAGGGIKSSGTLTLTNSTVSGNTVILSSLAVHVHGGGISNGGTMTLTNSTVSGNRSGWDCGGISNGGTMTLTNSTVSGNRSGWPPDGICSNRTLTLTNTLVDNDCYLQFGEIVSGGYNIESPGDTCGFDTNKGDQVNVSAEDLALEPLQDNGGPTETHAPGEGSVAIDVIPAVDCVDADGAPLTTDQRGQPRPGGSMCDVGAFEVQP